MAFDPMFFRYYDVETGTERVVEHGDKCVCGDCTKSRLKGVLDDIIKSRRAFAHSIKFRSTEKFRSRVRVAPSRPFEWKEPEVMYRPGAEVVGKINLDEGKCFGWSFDDTTHTEFYMLINNPTMSPDMTKDDMAVMSVDQQKAVLTLKVTYNPFFNERLKKSIESKYRNWSPVNKCWEIHPSKMKDVQAICGEFYKGVQIIGQKPVLGTKFEKLLSQLTKDDKASIYRLMALKYHPDKGGSHEVMSLINEVFKQ